MCEQADGGDKTAVERRGKEKRYGDASGAAAEPGSGVSAVGKRKSECVCSPAPSASSRLFSECHSLHYQSKVCVCLCAHHLIALTGALHAVESFLKAPFIFLAFFFALMIVHSNVHRSLMYLMFCTPNWQR